MPYAITTHELAPQPIISIRGRFRPVEMPGFIGSAFDRLFGWLGQSGIEPSGPPFAIYHDFGAEDIDAEVCVPVGAVLSVPEGMISRVAPATTVARTVHVGPYDELEAAYEAVSGWVERQGRTVAGPIQERYLDGPGDATMPSAYRTEIELPIVPTEVAVPA
jgi:effector-binding domain-containing protein